MDINGAIQAHSAWKMKLKAYLSDPDGTLKAGDIEPDNHCPLGKWIEEEVRDAAKAVRLGALKRVHAEFHTAAADVVRKADAGESTSEEVCLGSKSTFGNASSEVVKLLMGLQQI